MINLSKIKLALSVRGSHLRYFRLGDGGENELDVGEAEALDVMQEESRIRHQKLGQTPAEDDRGRQRRGLARRGRGGRGGRGERGGRGRVVVESLDGKVQVEDERLFANVAAESSFHPRGHFLHSPTPRQPDDAFPGGSLRRHRRRRHRRRRCRRCRRCRCRCRRRCKRWW